MVFVVVAEQLDFGLVLFGGVEPFEVLLLFVKLDIIFELDACIGMVGSHILLNGLTLFEVVVGRRSPRIRKN